MKHYPNELCFDCGKKYGNRPHGIVGCWLGTCGICGKEGSVCAPRDFGHLKPGWEKGGSAHE